MSSQIRRYLSVGTTCRRHFQLSPEERWSKLNFPKEKPPNTDIKLCWVAICRVVPDGSIPDRLGRLTTNGHKIWAWRHDKDNANLLHYKQSGVGIYTKPQRAHMSNRWIQTECGDEREQCGDICTTRQHGNYITITSSSQLLYLTNCYPTYCRCLSTGNAHGCGNPCN